MLIFQASDRHHINAVFAQIQQFVGKFFGKILGFCSGKRRNQSHGVTSDIRQGWNAMKPLPKKNTHLPKKIDMDFLHEWPQMYHEFPLIFRVGRGYTPFIGWGSHRQGFINRFSFGRGSHRLPTLLSPLWGFPVRADTKSHRDDISVSR